MFKVVCSTYELAKVISYLQMLCFYDFTVVTELKVMKYKFEKYERLIAIQNN